MTVIPKVICAPNKQVFLEAVLKTRKIKAGRYIMQRPYVIGAWVETSGNDQQTGLPKNKGV